MWGQSGAHSLSMATRKVAVFQKRGVVAYFQPFVSSKLLALYT